MFQIGPFVDVEHPDVQQGLLSTTFEEVFHKEVVTRVRVTTWCCVPMFWRCDGVKPVVLLHSVEVLPAEVAAG